MSLRFDLIVLTIFGGPDEVEVGVDVVAGVLAVDRVDSGMLVADGDVGGSGLAEGEV